MAVGERSYGSLSCDQTGEIVVDNIWCLWLPISQRILGPSTNRTRFSNTIVLNHPLNKMARQQQFWKKKKKEKGWECLSVFELLLNCIAAEDPLNTEDGR